MFWTSQLRRVYRILMFVLLLSSSTKIDSGVGHIFPPSHRQHQHGWRGANVMFTILTVVIGWWRRWWWRWRSTRRNCCGKYVSKYSKLTCFFILLSVCLSVCLSYTLFVRLRSSNNCCHHRCNRKFLRFFYFCYVLRFLTFFYFPTF